jgi:hypothetical protein
VFYIVFEFPVYLCSGGYGPGCASWQTAGIPYAIAHAGGKYFFEIEDLGDGAFYIGVASVNFSSYAVGKIGGDAISWSITDDGFRWHG